MSSASLPHIVIFPFMAKGHTIPLLHLARLLHGRRLAATTFITTPLNAPFIHNALPETDIVELHFPRTQDIPLGIESTDNLPSMSIFLPFVEATKLLQPRFASALSDLPEVDFLISDGFFGWSLDVATSFAIPRLVFYGMGNFSITVNDIARRLSLHAGVSSGFQTFSVPGISDLRICKDDLSPPFDEVDGDTTPFSEFVMELRKATRASHGIVVNSYYELEAEYVENWNREIGPKAWCVGPLCLAQPADAGAATSRKLMQWLDLRLEMDRPVLYIAFGTQANISEAQIEEIAIGLEQSRLDFLWILRSTKSEFIKGFEERVSDRGKVVKEWVNQLEILRHKSIKGFVSHCGWNSVLESICADVPILAWPMMAEQHLNAKFVVDVIEVGMRIRASDGTRDGLVINENISEMARELVLGEKGRTVRDKVKGFADLAKKAMIDGGSSRKTLEVMIEEYCRKRRELQNSRNMATV